MESLLLHFGNDDLKRKDRNAHFLRFGYVENEFQTFVLKELGGRRTHCGLERSNVRRRIWSEWNKINHTFKFNI